ncbi:Conserved_hypothetical protein [Hexamita inflata]|uniref:Uncharacterized protein n=1 Tax=Hexamita inflata TaxID=28002 RepID=A0ABP1H636_9EUKA
MISQLDLSKIQSDYQQSQIISNDSGRNYENISSLQLIDINSSMKLKISITIAYLLATTDSFKVEHLDKEYTITSKSFSGEMLERISKLIRIQPTVLLQAIEDIKIDEFMMNEISQCAFGVLNYIFKQFQTNHIWNVPDVYQLFDCRSLRNIENECIVLKKASPRASKIIGKVNFNSNFE